MVTSKSTNVTIVVLALLAISSSGCATYAERLRRSLPKQYPAEVKNWYSGTVDQTEFVREFSLADYQRVVVETLNTSSTPLPSEKDNTHEPVTVALRRSTEYFSTGLRDSLKGLIPVDLQGTQEDQNVLIVRGEVVEMNPGSRSARYWIGFGAGASRTAIQGELIDGSTRACLLRFKHARKSGMGFYGGDYADFLRDDTTDVGADVGILLSAFRGPEEPKKD